MAMILKATAANKSDGFTGDNPSQYIRIHRITFNDNHSIQVLLHRWYSEAVYTAGTSEPLEVIIHEVPEQTTQSFLATVTDGTRTIGATIRRSAYIWLHTLDAYTDWKPDE